MSEIHDLQPRSRTCVYITFIYLFLHSISHPVSSFHSIPYPFHSQHPLPNTSPTGDNIRFGLNKDLGFSEADRNENIRRIGEVAKLFADSGSIAITSFISPYIADRATARKLHDDAGIPFIEVYVDIPIEVAEQRDPKGLYKKARAGVIKGFTGIDAPYEAPVNAEIVVKNHELTVEEGVKVIVDYLTEKGLVTLKPKA